MTRHELRRRLGLAWNALRHGEPVRVTITAHLGFDPNAFDPADMNLPPPSTADDGRAILDAIRQWKPKGDTL